MDIEKALPVLNPLESLSETPTPDEIKLAINYISLEYGLDEKKLQGKDYMLEPEDVARTVQYLIDESETANAKLIELKPRRRMQFRG